MAAPLSPELLRTMDAYFRAANYLSVGQIYLLAVGSGNSGHPRSGKSGHLNKGAGHGRKRS